MNNPSSPTISKAVLINAPTSKVWEALTNPTLMKKWMFEKEIEILTDWQVGSPFITRGDLHGIPFVNNGRVLEFEPEKVLRYSHLSSISHLPDKPESYSIFEFQLAPAENQTALTLTVSNFPTETIYKHLAFYWNVTLEIFRKLVEQVE